MTHYMDHCFPWTFPMSIAPLAAVQTSLNGACFASLATSLMFYPQRAVTDNFRLWHTWRYENEDEG